MRLVVFNLKDNKMKNSLKQILKDHPQSIKAEVAEEALEHDDPKTFFQDLLQHGCISGMLAI